MTSTPRVEVSHNVEAVAGLSRNALWAYILIIAATWGTSFAFMKVIAAADTPPIVIAALRGLMTGAILAVWFACNGQNFPLDRRSIRHMAVLGMLNGLVPNVLTAVALTEIDSAPAALIQASTPLMVAVLAHFLLPGERLAGWSAAGLPLGFAGVFLLVGPENIAGGHVSAAGGAAMLGAALSYATSTIYLRLTKPSDPAAIALGQQIFATAPATGLALVAHPLAAWAIPPASWLAFAGLAAVATALPIVLYFRLVALAPVGKAASVQYVLPLAATVYGVFLLGEAVPVHAFLGGALVLMGVWVVSTGYVNRRSKQEIGRR